MLKLSFYLPFLLLSFSLWSSTSAQLPECQSFEKRPIEHFDFKARETGLKKRILVFSQIHGDEPQSLELSSGWIERLKKIGSPSNSWRIIPILNPDGKLNFTRYNARKVDLNRNFPTKDWDELALKFWQGLKHNKERRYPGESGGSEPETNCAIAHINDFKPDIVISIHTPYGLFDFDGPANKKIRTNLLPWKRLGTFPGSLGRYLWDERGIPVLTIELRPNSLEKNFAGYLLLQDSLSDLIP